MGLLPVQVTLVSGDLSFNALLTPQKSLLPTGLTCLCDVVLRLNLGTLTGSELFHVRKSYLLGVYAYFFLTIIILFACVHAPETFYALAYTNILFHFFKGTTEIG